eukprot:CAMPEP_0197442326 /NCGR_PEP_ID=MMETSP1175-20131217/8366_1 /TAXON_ID=1003142 /ORGANISM="Triceratium dubium, Strain CCMP147" /LENGTH=141 /DNA_ID=CAMNT_0042972773 /DNA_START=313 /DNA_END=737 /DNA_ORIENTATION=-
MQPHSPGPSTLAPHSHRRDPWPFTPNTDTATATTAATTTCPRGPQHFAAVTFLNLSPLKQHTFVPPQKPEDEGGGWAFMSTFEADGLGLLAEAATARVKRVLADEAVAVAAHTARTGARPVLLGVGVHEGGHDGLGLLAEA